MMHNIPQKSHINVKVLVEWAILGLLHTIIHIIRCEDQRTVYHLLILGGAIFLVIFIGKCNKELSHTTFQEDPRWATNLAHQSYDVLKSLGGIA